jgi:hypothetical protein
LNQVKQCFSSTQLGSRSITNTSFLLNSEETKHSYRNSSKGLKEEGAFPAHFWIPKKVFYAEDSAFPAHSVNGKKRLTSEGASIAHKLASAREDGNLVIDNGIGRTTETLQQLIPEGASPAHGSVHKREGANPAHLSAPSKGNSLVDKGKGWAPEGALTAHDPVLGREDSNTAHLLTPQYTLENTNNMSPIFSHFPKFTLLYSNKTQSNHACILSTSLLGPFLNTHHSFFFCLPSLCPPFYLLGTLSTTSVLKF